MNRFRHWLHRQRAFAALLVAAALALRVVVPAGFMPMVSQDGIRIVLCSGHGPVMTPADMAGMAGMDMGKHGQQDGHGQSVCAYASLFVHGVADADLPAITAPATLHGIVPVPVLEAQAPRPAARLRPPGRAPPAQA